VTGAEYIAAGAAVLALLIAVGGVVFNAGKQSESQAKTEMDLNGMGQKVQRLAIVALCRVPKEEQEELMRFVLLGTPRKEK
jgi:hypothetical protein